MPIDDNIKVLVVDDQPASLAALVTLIGSLGIQPVTAASGREALREVLSDDFALILLDVQMPVMDGLETAALIRQRHRSRLTPIMFVTAYASLDQQVLEGYGAGAVDYIIKPFLPQILQSKISVYTELFHQRRQLASLNETLEQQVAQRTAELQAKHEEVRAMSQQLWQAAKLATMGELAASIAHELNNPLAIVSLRVEGLVAQLPPDDPQRVALQVIEHEVERMANLVANLLQFSRRSVQQISTVDVREEVENTLELIHHHLRNHRVTVARDFAPDVPLIQVDRQQLRQVFLNLCTNAVDAMPEGGILTLRVRTQLPTPAAGAGGASPSGVVIEVADTGAGIRPEDLPGVMEPFVTTKAEGKGTGLGLPICRRIVQEHGGAIELESEAGRGTTVRIALPCVGGSNAAHLTDT